MKTSKFTESEVGKDGMAAAFLLIQHSTDFEFKEKMLPVLKKSYFNGEGITVSVTRTPHSPVS